MIYNANIQFFVLDYITKWKDRSRCNFYIWTIFGRQQIVLLFCTVIYSQFVYWISWWFYHVPNRNAYQFVNFSPSPVDSRVWYIIFSILLKKISVHYFTRFGFKMIYIASIQVFTRAINIFVNQFVSFGPYSVKSKL